MKQKLNFLITTALGFLLIATSINVFSQTINPTKILSQRSPINNKIDLLFIQQAASAKLIPNNNNYLLTLTDANKHILYFSDQPARIAGTLSPKHFFHDWNRNYKNKKGPNVAMEATTKVNGKMKHVSAVFTLTNPHYDEHTNTITYLAYPLNNQKLIVNSFENVTLFFDKFQGWPP